MSITVYLFIAVFGFLAAAIDSIAGGGGLISLPALIAAGIPAHVALGTNKFASSTASFTSTIMYARSGNIDFGLIKYIFPFTLIGSVLGAKTVLLINPSVIQPVVLVLMLGAALYTLFSKDLGTIHKPLVINRRNIVLGCFFGFLLGFYDGFFGPGTGSFLVFVFVAVFGFDFIHAAGNAKILNFVSNIFALFTFLVSGRVQFLAGIVMAFSMIVGAIVGTKLSILKGSRLIKPVFIIIVASLFLKLLLGL